MNDTLSSPGSTDPDLDPRTRVTRSLLGWGVVAGPIYVGVSLTEAATRDGFDLTRHSWSLLANGSFGWIHIANLIVSGLAVLAFAVGLRRALSPGRASTWGPALIGLFGLSMVGAGMFVADPVAGFPPGTPETTDPTTSGILHLAIAAIGFIGLSASGFVLARRFTAEGRRGLSRFSVVTGIVFLAGWIAIATGQNPAQILTFIVGLLVALTWLATVAVHLYRRPAL